MLCTLFTYVPDILPTGRAQGCSGSAQAESCMLHSHPIPAGAWVQNIAGQRNKWKIGKHHLIFDCTKGIPESLYLHSLQTTKSKGEEKVRSLREERATSHLSDFGSV